MPTSADAVLLDTSAAVALCVASHEHHEQTFAALAGTPLGLAGHAAFETFSVLTRLPEATRLQPESASRVIAQNFPHTHFLSTRATQRLLPRLAQLGIAGARSTTRSSLQQPSSGMCH